jgi:hypothetical protein
MFLLKEQVDHISTPPNVKVLFQTQVGAQRSASKIANLNHT